MPSRKEEEPEPFKVVDRRPFTSEGERRTDVEEEPEPAKPPQVAKPQASPAGSPPSAAAPDAAKGGTETKSAPAGVMAKDAAASAEGLPQGPPLGPVQFEHLVMSLISSAMFQLGMAAQPGQPPPRPDLAAAQETIDLLGVLENKTQGNLTPEETQLLSGGLQELRLAFVELSRRAGRIR
jgi:Domain of unknown function (DUF1844)